MDQNQNTAAVAKGTDKVSLVYEKCYEEGDSIRIELSEGNRHVWLQLDDALGKALVYLKGNMTYYIPFHERRTNLSPKAFWGNKHLLTVKAAADYEIEAYRNLAYNVCDQRHIKNLYPHAEANVETRGEAVFAAQNAIDGVTANHGHGEWPYASWGINRQEDARIRIDFGRSVSADRIVLYTRADFPHDSWWEQVSFTFSDESELIMEMKKSDKPHSISFPTKKISWIEMHDLKKCSDPSPFPALTQIEVYGVG